jgi:hypothetical protein
VRIAFVCLSCLWFLIAFVHTWLSFDQRVIGYYDQVLAHVEIGFGAHVAANPGTLRIEDVLQLCADTFADDEADNCSISAIDKHVVDYPEQSSTFRDHFVTDDVGHAWQAIEFNQFLHRRSAHSHCIRPNRMHGGSGNHPPFSRSTDKRFAVHNDKTSYALAVTLDDDFLDFPEPLRGFHVDDSTSD